MAQLFDPKSGAKFQECYSNIYMSYYKNLIKRLPSKEGKYNEKEKDDNQKDFDLITLNFTYLKLELFFQGFMNELNTEIF